MVLFRIASLYTDKVVLMGSAAQYDKISPTHQSTYNVKRLHIHDAIPLLIVYNLVP